MSVTGQALDLLAACDWSAAHVLVQDDPSPEAAWLHGIVHILEGDLENARYWYGRAGRAFPSPCDAAVEIGRARAQLVAG